MEFEILYHKLRPQFIKVAKGFLPMLRDSSVEVTDLVQEGAILLMGLMETYQGDDRKLSSLAVVSYANFLRNMVRSQNRLKMKHDAVDCDSVAELLSDDSFPEDLMLQIFVNELCEILSRVDAQVLRELMLPSIAAAEAIKAKSMKGKVTVSEIHIAKATGRTLREVRGSIRRIRSAVAQEFFI